MNIPRYPDSRPLDLEDKALLDNIFSRIQPRISEFTFANLYLFRRAHEYRLTKVDKALVILARGYGGEPYFLLPPDDGVKDALNTLLSDGLTLYGADATFVGKYLKGRGAEIIADRDSFDYLYLRQELAELPGNRFHKKKNRINYFTGRHRYSIEEYGDRHLHGCLDLLAEWRRVREEIENGSVALEVDANAEALRSAASLGLQGVVALVEGSVKAFALGERLNSDTSVCHFEKADPFMEGLYQLIDREFNRLLFTDCTYVNREQDLGIINLRDSKLSYHPVELIEKYRVRRQALAIETVTTGEQ
jgi:hypothetical protein